MCNDDLQLHLDLRLCSSPFLSCASKRNYHVSHLYLASYYALANMTFVKAVQALRHESYKQLNLPNTLPDGHDLRPDEQQCDCSKHATPCYDDGTLNCWIFVA